ncbi:hypothetical protein JGS39_00200 [Streptomyces sp. P01-B04]|nr:hypothetical protein [Streptomyces poriferorum]MBW5255483.1 hypothetical protein [Streptomyces poriferorum]
MPAASQGIAAGAQVRLPVSRGIRTNRPSRTKIVRPERCSASILRVALTEFGGHQRRQCQPSGAAELPSRAAAQLVSGRLLESREAAEEALRSAEKSDDATLLSSALSVVGELAREEGRLDAARDIARRAVSTARRTGDPTLLAFDQSNLAGAELLAGDQVRAAALADAAVRLARSLGSSWVLPYALVVLAEVELRCGRLPQAEAALGECAEAVALTRDPQVLDGMRRLSEELAAAWGHTDRQRFPRSAGPGQAPDEWWGT